MTPGPVRGMAVPLARRERHSVGWREPDRRLRWGASRDCAAIDAQANPNDVLNAGVGVDGISDAGGDGFFGQGGNAAPSSGDEGTVGAGGGGAGYGGGGGGTYSPGQMGLGAAAAVPVEASLDHMQPTRRLFRSPPAERA